MTQTINAPISPDGIMAMLFAESTIGLILLIFWIWLIIDVSRIKFDRKDDKYIWLALILTGGPIAGLVYIFTVRKNIKNKKNS